MGGERPCGLGDRRSEWASIYGAVRPATGEDFALVLPLVSIAAMSTFLAEFAVTIPTDTPAGMVLHQAGWHGSRRLRVPDTITLIPLPSYAPQLNPVEPVWLHLGEQVLSPPRTGGLRGGRHRLLQGLEQPHGRTPPLLVQVSLDRKAQFISTLVSRELCAGGLRHSM